MENLNTDMTDSKALVLFRVTPAASHAIAPTGESGQNPYKLLNGNFEINHIRKGRPAWQVMEPSGQGPVQVASQESRGRGSAQAREALGQLPAGLGCFL